VADRPAALPDPPDLTLAAHVATDHRLVSQDGDLRGIVDQAQEAQGQSCRVILALPARVAAGFGLVAATPPLAIRRLALSAVWHRRSTCNPRLDWLRAQRAA